MDGIKKLVRFVVRPIDNCGTLGPRPRDRSWQVYDRQMGREVSEHDTRIAARTEARQMNGQES